MSAPKFKRYDVVRVTEDAKLPVRAGKFLLVTKVLRFNELYEEARSKMGYLDLDEDTPVYCCYDCSGFRHFIPEYSGKSGVLSKRISCVEYATPEQEALMISVDQQRKILNILREQKDNNENESSNDDRED